MGAQVRQQRGLTRVAFTDHDPGFAGRDLPFEQPLRFRDLACLFETSALIPGQGSCERTSDRQTRLARAIPVGFNRNPR
jgi:hypothetical protein